MMGKGRSLLLFYVHHHIMSSGPLIPQIKQRFEHQFSISMCIISLYPQIIVKPHI